jgi:opacity protein-like surface antigen
MGTVRALAAASLIAAGFAAPAVAADMLMPPLRGYQAVQPAIVEVGTGWYLRGDVGYTDYKDPVDEPLGAARPPFDSIKLDTSWSAGGGFGYKFLTWLRADVTADYRFESDFVANSSQAEFSRRDWAKFDSTTVLVNGYVDLGTWYGITPYAGAGVGAAFNRFKEYQSQVTCVTTACGTGAPGAFAVGAQPIVELDDELKTSLAWALMGGVAVDVGGGFQIDAGYRYVNLGEARSKPDAAGAVTRAKELEAHEVRLGFRYMID